MAKDKTSRISIQKTSDAHIADNKEVTVYYTPDFMKITDVKNHHNISYKKISNEEFINLHTGEITVVTKRADGKRSIESLRKSFKRLSLLINCNFCGDKSEVFISLSYRYEVTDKKQINKDIDSLWDGFQRKNKDNVPFRCLIIMEYTKCGRLHFHALLKRLDGNCLSIKDVQQKFIWTKGTVDIRCLYVSDGISEYLSPFNVSRKRNQLKYYTSSMQIYRRKGQFVNPEKLKMSSKEAFDLAIQNSFSEYKRKAFDIVDNLNNDIVNTIRIVNLRKEDAQ